MGRNVDQSAQPRTQFHAERLKRGWSQEEVGWYAHVSKQAISQVEMGGGPQLRTAAALAKAFDMTVEELFPEIFAAS